MAELDLGDLDAFTAVARPRGRCRPAPTRGPCGPRIRRLAAAAGPAYLAAHGRPEHPKDLLDHACIRHRFLSGVTLSSWEFKRDGEVVRINPTGPLIATTIDLEISAAIAGL